MTDSRSPADHNAENDEDSSHGWDAIDAVAEAIYGEQEPHHYGSIISYRLGGEDPLQGISVYRNKGDAGSKPHWTARRATPRPRSKPSSPESVGQ